MDRLPLKLNDATGVPYYRQIVDQIADLVRSGQLGPTEQLPSVRDLAAQLLVSLITVRRAYADLEAARLIVRRQGYGTYVADSIEQASREQTLAEARTVLAEALGHMLRLGLSAADIRALVGELLDGREDDDGRR